MEVEHVKAHRSKKEMQQMSLFEEKSITEGSEKADEPAKERAMLNGGGDMAQVRAVTVQQERVEVGAALLSAVWWKNGRNVKSLHQCQKKAGYL